MSVDESSACLSLKALKRAANVTLSCRLSAVFVALRIIKELSIYRYYMNDLCTGSFCLQVELGPQK